MYRIPFGPAATEAGEPGWGTWLEKLNPPLAYERMQDLPPNWRGVCPQCHIALKDENFQAINFSTRQSGGGLQHTHRCPGACPGVY